MKVLFIFRDKPRGNQLHLALRSNLEEAGIEVDVYTHISEGLPGYIKNAFALRNFLASKSYDVLHAHFSYSGYLAAFARREEALVCSLLGSDVNSAGKISRSILKIAIKYFWDATIVKTVPMQEMLDNNDLHVIPNGVNFEKFYPLDSLECKSKVGFDPSKFNIIFISSDLNSPGKNFRLAAESVNRLNDPDVILHPLTNKTHEELLYYYNAADLLLFTSIHEGSPNVIKEAMACNLPIISTDVGDSRRTLANAKGCYIVGYSADEIADKIKLVQSSKARTNGRDCIPFLNSEFTNQQIIQVYTEIKKNK